MIDWLISIIAIVKSLTTEEIVKGLFINMVSSFLEASGKWSLSLLKGSKNMEAQIKDCFYSAVEKNIKNDQITEYVREHDFELYVTALKRELMSDELTFAAGSSDAQILADFRKELSKKPFISLQMTLLYGKELCKSSKEIQKKINSLVEKSKNIEKQQAAIQEKLRQLSSEQGYSLSISDGLSGDFICPIPDKYFQRVNVVTCLANKLREKGRIYIYGGYKTGKSVLSCLVAKQFPDFVKVRIPINYGNVYSIKEIVHGYGTHKKVLYLVDGIAYRDEAVISDLCQFLDSQDKNERLFVLNGRVKLSDYSSEQLNLTEEEVPNLDQDDIAELLPRRVNHLSSLITTLSSGNPWVATMMIKLLDSRGWPEENDALWTLLQFGREVSLDGKMRRILHQIIPNRDSVKLLNRMLLVKNKMDKDVCRQLAAIEPVISLPDSCLDDLAGTVITVFPSDEITINPAFQKLLEPDLLPKERKDCDVWLARKITSKQVLDEMDVTNAISYMLDAQDYEQAGLFFLSCLIGLGSKDFSKYVYISSMWADVKLPEQMPAFLQIFIRVQQISLFKKAQSRYSDFQLKDLERLVEGYEERDVAKSMALQQLFFQYGMLSNTDKALTYYQQLKEMPPTADGISLLEDNMWISLYGACTEAEIYDWIERYDQENRPNYAFIEEIENQAVTNVRMRGKESDVEGSLLRIKQYAEGKYIRELYGFIVGAETNLIMYYGSLKDYQSAKDAYNKSAYLQTEFGRLMLNFSLGLSLYNDGNYREARGYLEQALKIDNIKVSSVNVLYAHIYYSAILSEENSEESEKVLSCLLNNPAFATAYTDDEKVLMYGEIGIAYWNNGKRSMSVEYFLKVEQYLWRHKDNMDSIRLRIFMALSTCMTNYYGLVRALPIRQDVAKPHPTMFILERPGINDLYSDFQEVVIRFYLYYLQKEYLWQNDLSLEVLDHSMSLLKSNLIETRPECVTLVLECLPDLLCQDRFDDAVYVVVQSAKALVDSDIVKHPEGAIMMPSLLYFMLYRLDCFVKGEPFDDCVIEGVLNDFVSYHPQDCEFTKYFLSILNGEKDVIINGFADEYCRTIVLLYSLSKNRTSQWFVAIQRLFVQLYEYNRSNYCGQFLECVTTDMLVFLLNTRPEEFRLEEKSKEMDNIQKYSGFNRVRSVLACMHYLLKVAPDALPKELEDILDLSIDLDDLKK